jgi:hypothetical protein
MSGVVDNARRNIRDLVMDVIDVEMPEGEAFLFGARGYIEVRSLEREKGRVELVVKNGDTDEPEGLYRVHLIVEELVGR